jgi:hypothetical protein
LRAGLRPPLKLHVRFSRMQLSRRHDLRCKEKLQPSGPYLTSVKFGASLQYPRTMTYGFFAKRTDPPSSSLLFWLPASSFLPSRRSLGYLAFAALQVLFGSPTTDRASLATSLSFIGSLTPVLPGDSVSSPEVTRCSSVPCYPQSPWCGG